MPIKPMYETRFVHITRYLTPLREGGSLPAITEADDGFLYVTKFRGAGQGSKALVADFIGGMLAKEAGFNVPELVFMHLDESFGRTEPDEEIQDLLKFSTGLNLGVSYLSGAITFDPAVSEIDFLTASKIVWLDYLLTNMDRTSRNTNMLTWKGELWLIDHGASLYFHHNWPLHEQAATKVFALIKDHVLFNRAKELEKAHAFMTSLITEQVIDNIVNLLPETWLESYKTDSPDEIRKVYKNFLKTRLGLIHEQLKTIIHG